MKAVEHQHRDCAAILLEHGADPNHRGVSGSTALHFAVMASSKSLVELLLEHGADINAKDKLGYTPLTLAITENCEEMVKFLLQKGADVNAQDNILRTPLIVATASGNESAIRLLLHHGAVFPESDKGFYPCQAFTKMVQNDVIANERIGSSCYETTPLIPLETPALAESCDVPKEEAAEKEDSSPAANHKVSVCTNRVLTYRDYKAEGPEKKEDKCPLWNPEPNSEVLDKAAATVLLPADVCRMFPEPSVAKGSNKGAWQAAGAAKEEDNGSLCNPKHLSDLIDKVINSVQRPAGKHSRRVSMCSAAEECGKGVLQPAGGAAEKEDTDSPLDSETDPKGQGKVQASTWFPAANSSRLDACSAAVEHGKGVLSAASVEAEKEDGDTSWDSEPFSEIVEVFAGKRLPAADRKGMGVCSAAAELSKGVLQPTGGSGEDPNDSSWDSEVPFLKEMTDSEGEGKVSAAVQLPSANSNKLDACSAVVEYGKGVLKRAWREVIKEDRVLQPAEGEAEHEDNDFPWDSETDSEGEGKVLADVQLPAADQNRVGVSSAAVEHIKAARAEREEHFISSSEKKLKDLKEPFHKNDYYAESGKNALKEKKLITVLRNMQGRLVDSFDSSAAAIPQLQEHIQRLQIQMARLEATIQQQDKTIEVFETIQQVSYRKIPIAPMELLLTYYPVGSSDQS
ncbi:hypothetical protein Nmel_002814 [Mimus melanotis]